jgi:hypothetical protein
MPAKRPVPPGQETSPELAAIARADELKQEYVEAYESYMRMYRTLGEMDKKFKAMRFDVRDQIARVEQLSNEFGQMYPKLYNGEITMDSYVTKEMDVAVAKFNKDKMEAESERLEEEYVAFHERTAAQDLLVVQAREKYKEVYFSLYGVTYVSKEG